ncbi:hypothetical protein PQQ65_32535 [Paraburkholderia strydomiana]|uniref:hypothetical protein n=1 Tax=Paraburkholderia strydomiana TaxID=1245417 RepID=UPI0038BA1087
MQRQLAAAADEQKAAQTRIAALEQQLDTTHEQADTELDALRARTHDREVAAFRASVGTRDAASQSELNRATRRMEGVQKHMMQQISEARDERKRA